MSGPFKSLVGLYLLKHIYIYIYQAVKGAPPSTWAASAGPADNREFRKKEMKTKQQNAQGAVFMAGASRTCKFVKLNLRSVDGVDLLGLFYAFSQQASSCVRSIAVRSATFRRNLLL